MTAAHILCISARLAAAAAAAAGAHSPHRPDVHLPFLYIIPPSRSLDLSLCSIPRETHTHEDVNQWSPLPRDDMW